MVTINQIEQQINLNESIKLGKIYGFATENAICLLNNECDSLIVMWVIDDSIEVYDVGTYSTIKEIICGTNLCDLEDVMKVMYSASDFTISVNI